MRAALEMLELMDGFNQEQAARGGPEIRIGIGIASGPLVGTTVEPHESVEEWLRTRIGADAPQRPPGL